MAYGEDIPEPKRSDIWRRVVPVTPPPQPDRFDEREDPCTVHSKCNILRLIHFSDPDCLVQTEIGERRSFLEEMERLGQGDKYRSIIETEISRV